MKLGQTVAWRSQAAGSWRDKQGAIVEVVPAGAQPSKMPGAGWGRQRESYVVKVGSRLYWPHVGALKLVATEAAPACPTCGRTMPEATP